MIRVSDDASGTLGAYVRFALAESKVPRIGGESVLGAAERARCSCTSCGAISKACRRSRPTGSRGCATSRSGRALAALHRNPRARMDVAVARARSGHLRVSVLAERFMQFVGHPPIEYLTSWRMQLAANQLRSSTESVAEIANRVGYESEAAFSRRVQESGGRAAERVAQDDAVAAAREPRYRRPCRSSPLDGPRGSALLRRTRVRGAGALDCSLDLGRSTSRVDITEDEWAWQGTAYPHLEVCKERTIYHWTGAAFEPISRYTSALIKLVPTEWGAADVRDRWHQDAADGHGVAVCGCGAQGRR